MKTSPMWKRIGALLLVCSLLIGLVPVLSTPAEAANWNMEYFLKKYSDSHFNLKNNPNGYMTIEEFIAIVTTYSYYGDGSSNTPATDKYGKQPSAWCAKYVQAEVDKRTVSPEKIGWSDPVTVAFAAQFLARAKGKYSYDSNNLYNFTGTQNLSPDDILYLSVAVDHGLIPYKAGMNVAAKIQRKDAYQYEIPTGTVTCKAPSGVNNTHMKELHAYYVADVLDTDVQLKNLKAAADDITMVTIGAGYLQSGGGLLVEMSKCSETMQALDFCQDSGKIALLGIINYSGGFSNDLVSALISSESAMDGFVSKVMSAVRQYDFDGVNMGLEVSSGGSSMRGGYGRLLAKLSDALHAEGKVLLTTVGAYFTDSQENSSFYDYAAIDAVSDYIHVILYDDYNDTNYAYRKTYGTMSNIIRVGRVLRYCATAMDPDKLLMGMGAFAIDYNTSKLTAKDISYSEAVSLQSRHSASLITDTQEDGVHFAYADGTGNHLVYFESASGVDNRMALVNRYGLAGSSVYYLGAGHTPMVDAVSARATFKPEIMSAMEEGLIPLNLRSRYDHAITRAEFCQMIAAFLEAYSGMDAEAFVKRQGKTIDPTALTDTSDNAVLAAYALGIVTGYGNGIFGPERTITRQEAATMLARLAGVVGCTEPNASSVSFTELSTIPKWFIEGVKFTSSCQDPLTGKRVMGGVGNNRFDPTGSYTREQSLMTLIRLYHVVTN